MISQSDGYLVLVEHKHVTGRPLLFALINETAKHSEMETYLSNREKESLTDYFIIPPMAADGVGYTAYFSNDSIGRDVTINEIERVRFYRIPYNDMVNLKFSSSSDNLQNTTNNLQLSSAFHPNPSYYDVTFNKPTAYNQQPATLILSQSFHPGWTAYAIPENSRLAGIFPFLLGRKLENHVLVNNWANGWQLDSLGNQPTTIVLFFLPQLLEWFGFILMPVPFLMLLIKRK